jgi:hypothetical protein
MSELEIQSGLKQRSSYNWGGLLSFLGGAVVAGLVIVYILKRNGVNVPFLPLLAENNSGIRMRGGVGLQGGCNDNILNSYNPHPQPPRSTSMGKPRNLQLQRSAHDENFSEIIR